MGFASKQLAASGEYQQEGAKLFSVVPSNTRGNGLKLKYRKLHMGNKFFIVKVTEHWKKLPRDTVGSPSLEILETCPDVILGNVHYVTLLETGGLD